jgi:hypothetical protein
MFFALFFRHLTTNTNSTLPQSKSFDDNIRAGLLIRGSCGFAMAQMQPAAKGEQHRRQLILNGEIMKSE